MVKHEALKCVDGESHALYISYDCNIKTEFTTCILRSLLLEQATILFFQLQHQIRPITCILRSLLLEHAVSLTICIVPTIVKANQNCHLHFKKLIVCSFIESHILYSSYDSNNKTE